MLIIRGVNVYPSQFEDLILQIGLFAPHYLLEVERVGNLDSVTLGVEFAAGVDCNAREGAAAQLEHLVKAYIGINIEVRVGPSGSLTRSVGKARHVVDKRKDN